VSEPEPIIIDNSDTEGDDIDHHTGNHNANAGSGGDGGGGGGGGGAAGGGGGGGGNGGGGNIAANNDLLRHRMLARGRAIKRFNALLQRIQNCGIRTALGEVSWKSFVSFVRRHFRPAFLRLFAPTDDVLRCCGTIDGDRCPHRFTVNFASTQSIEFDIAGLHLDHEYDVRHICDTWLRTMPAHPRSWDDGVNGLRVAHLLFGVQPLGNWPARLRFRCGNNRYYGRDDQDFNRFCHTTDIAHYNRVLTRADFVGGAAV
jgi:hypothetical protein